jgi:glucose/arabinose dehydrogenase
VVTGILVFAVAIAAAIGAAQPNTVTNSLGSNSNNNNNASISIFSTNKSSIVDPFKAIPDPNLPRLHDPSLMVEKVVDGMSEPTSMTFVGDNLLVTQKSGDVRLVKDGVLQGEDCYRSMWKQLANVVYLVWPIHRTKYSFT